MSVKSVLRLSSVAGRALNELVSVDVVGLDQRLAEGGLSDRVESGVYDILKTSLTGRSCDVGSRWHSRHQPHVSGSFFHIWAI